MEVDHDWLKNVFSVYGDVVYVSVPTYKTTRKLKGFAFVQFGCPESADKAIRVSLSTVFVITCLSDLQFVFLFTGFPIRRFVPVL